MRTLALAVLAVLGFAGEAFSQTTVVQNRGLLGRRTNIVQVGGGGGVIARPQAIVQGGGGVTVVNNRGLLGRRSEIIQVGGGNVIAPQRLLVAPLRVQNVVAPSNVTVVQNRGLLRNRVTVVNNGIAVAPIQQAVFAPQAVVVQHAVQQQLLVGRRLQLNQLNTYGYTPYNTVQNIQYAAPQQVIQVPTYQLVQPVQIVQAAPVTQPAPMIAPMKAPEPAPVKAPETTPMSVVDPCPPQVQQIVQPVYVRSAPQYIVSAPQRQYIAQCH